MVTVNAMGDKCPVPVIKTKKALDALTEYRRNSNTGEAWRG